MKKVGNPSLEQWRRSTRRALEMAEKLPEKGNARAQARGQIAIALLAKP